MIPDLYQPFASSSVTIYPLRPLLHLSGCYISFNHSNFMNFCCYIFVSASPDWPCFPADKGGIYKWWCHCFILFYRNFLALELYAYNNDLRSDLQINFQYKHGHTANILLLSLRWYVPVIEFLIIMCLVLIFFLCNKYPTVPIYLIDYRNHYEIYRLIL